MTEPRAADHPGMTPSEPTNSAPPPAPTDPAAKARRDNLLWAALLVILTLIVYQPAIRGTFLWDDSRYVMTGSNSVLRSADGLVKIWLHPSTGTTPETFTTIQYYPLTFTAFWLQYQLWELNPVGYHVVNVVLHAGAALILWQLLKLLRVPGAWVAAAAFALHPIEVESVAWITELKNVLSCILGLGAVYAYLRFAESSEGPESKPAWPWYAAAFALFAGAVFAKSVMSLAPVVIALLIFWRFRGAFNVRTLAGLLPFLIIGGLMGRKTAWMEKFIVGADGPDWHHTFTERLLVAGHAFWFYPIKLIAPFNLTFIYPRWDASNPGQWVHFGLMVAVVAAAAWMVTVPRFRGAGVAILAYTVLLFPAMGFFDVFPMRYSYVADHFQYHAGIALIALVVAAVARRVWRGEGQPGAQGVQVLTGVVLFALAVMTWRQASIYASPIALWEDTVAKNPSAWMAHNNLGADLMQRAADQRAEGQVDAATKSLTEATEHFDKAIMLRPGHAAAYEKWGTALADLGRVPEAIEKLEKSIKLDPKRDEPHVTLGEVYMRTNRNAEARAEFEKAIALDPKSWRAHLLLGQLAGLAGKLPEAEASFRRAVELRPNDADAQFGLATTLEFEQKYPEALTHAIRAAELQPQNPLILTKLGVLYGTNGRPAESFDAFKRALQIDPNNAAAQEGARLLINAVAEHVRAATRPATTRSATTTTTTRAATRANSPASTGPAR